MGSVAISGAPVLETVCSISGTLRRRDFSSLPAIFKDSERETEGSLAISNSI